MRSKPAFRPVGLALCIATLVYLLFAPPLLWRGVNRPLPNPIEPSPGPTFRGVLQLWHVPVFDVAMASGSGYLSARAREFEKLNHGIFIEVSALSPERAREAMSNGQYPDLLSFGGGFVDAPASLLQPLDASLLSGVRAELAAACAHLGVPYSVPFMMGGYLLAANRPKLPDGLDSPLPAQALAELTESLLPKGRGQSRSALWAVASRMRSPYAALAFAYSDQGEGFKLSGALPLEGETAYKAYAELAQSSLLAGTTREAVRLDDAQRQNTAPQTQFLALPPRQGRVYTDLVQSIGIIGNGDVAREQAAQSFIEFLLGEEAQRKVALTGMFPAAAGMAVHQEKPDSLLAQMERAYAGALAVPNQYWSAQQYADIAARAHLFLKGESGAAQSFTELIAPLIQ